MSAVMLGASKMRPMREVDLAVVAALERSAYPFPWSELVFRDCLRVGYSCWVRELDGGIAGYGILSLVTDECHLLNLCIAPVLHGQGLGRQMLTFLLDKGRRHGADTVLLEVRPSNAAAIHLYRSMGFDTIGVRRGYYPAEDGREDALIFARAL